MSSKLSELKFKQVGLNLNVVIGDKPLSIKIEDKEVRDALKEKMNQYRTKKTATLLKEIEAALTPQSTEKKVAKEKEIEDIKASIKKEKKVAKESKGVSKVKKEAIAEVTKALKGKATKALPAAQKALPAKAATKTNLVDDLGKQIEDGKMSQADIDKLQALLNKNKKAEAVAPKASTGVRRSGEY